MQEHNPIATLATQYINSTHRHVFLTGKAGTGKTTFLRDIVNKTHKTTVVAAPTGIAAINAGGVTLHSLLQLPFGVFIPDSTPLTGNIGQVNRPNSLFQGATGIKMHTQKREMIKKIELMIIDEVSMLRADLLDCIDHVLRHIRRNSSPFGGIQMLFIGDLLQLPPVVRDTEWQIMQQYYPNAYFFQAHALQQQTPIKIELNKVYRQSDHHFIAMLNRLRYNDHNDEDLALLSKHYRKDISDGTLDGYIHLTTHNRKADQINQKKLDSLQEKLVTYNAEVKGQFPENALPCTAALQLKVGAQIMFIKNDPTSEKRFFNGKLATIAELQEDYINITLADQEDIVLEKYTWENKRYTLNKNTQEIEEKHLGSFQQYPIRLAWAVTIHKSQGLTFEQAILDLSQVFAPGQLYVALSRLTSLKGLILSSKLPQIAPKVDPSLRQFSDSFHDEPYLQTTLALERKNYIAESTTAAFTFAQVLYNLKIHLQGFSKSENRSTKQQYLQWTLELEQQTLAIHQIANKFVQEVKRLLVQQDYQQILNQRFQKAVNYFNENVSKIADTVKQHRKSISHQTQVRTYIKELQEFEDAYLQQLKQIQKLALYIAYHHQGKILTKAILQEQLDTIPTPQPTKQKTTTHTTETTFNLWKQGKSITEIATHRKLMTNTILGHISQYVAKGEIPIESLMDKNKITTITQRINPTDLNEKLSTLKADLGDSISYGEIRLVLAHIQQTQH